MRRAAALAVVAVLLTGCTAPSSTPTPAPPATTPTPVPLPATSPPVTPRDTSSPDRRPVAPPDVVVAGVTDPPPGLGVERYRGQRPSWGRCPDGRRFPESAECATVLAPVDHAAPDGRALTLSLTRMPATREPKLGTIFVNPGGPGEGGRALAARFARAGLEQYDIVGWDPRGTGRSTPVACADGVEMDAFLAMDQTPDDAAERAAYVDASRAFGQSCLARSGDLLRHVATVDTVRDLDLLRTLVGDAKLHYLGYSYGTDIGSRYAEMFPDRVGRVVLDSAINPTDDQSIIQAMGFDRSLEAFADWCVQKRCALGNDRGAVIGAVTGLLEGLDARPIPVGDRLLTQTLGVTGVILPLYGGENSYPMLARGVGDARRGRGETLVGLADLYNGRSRAGRYEAQAWAFFAIRCLDRGDGGIAGAEDEARDEGAKAPHLGPFFGPDLVCPTWPVAPLPKQPPVRAVGAAPILVVGTTGDSATPYEYAVRMARQLQSGVLVTRVGPGHAAYGHGNACVDRAVVDYFTGKAPSADVRCE